VRDDREWLSDIHDAITHIEKYAAKGWEIFSQDELIQTWISYHLQIIVESARNVSSQTTEKYPDVPWGEIIGLRNVLVHHYFDLDLEVTWGIVQNDLPPLKEQVEAIRREQGGA